MDLFNNSLNQNILPFNGEVIDYGIVLTFEESTRYFNQLFNENFWENDELVLFGKRIVTARKVAWFGDADFQYSYSNTIKKAHSFTQELLKLKSIVEEISGEKFNSCLLNLYHNGNEGLGWHQDNEKELGPNPVIASLSLGAIRKFSFKHISTKTKIDHILQPGSLIVMKGETQNCWLHALPKSKKVLKPRINLTFRTILG